MIKGLLGFVVLVWGSFFPNYYQEDRCRNLCLAHQKFQKVVTTLAFILHQMRVISVTMGLLV